MRCQSRVAPPNERVVPVEVGAPNEKVEPVAGGAPNEPSVEPAAGAPSPRSQSKEPSVEPAAGASSTSETVAGTLKTSSQSVEVDGIDGVTEVT